MFGVRNRGMTAPNGSPKRRAEAEEDLDEEEAEHRGRLWGWFSKLPGWTFLPLMAIFTVCLLLAFMLPV